MKLICVTANRHIFDGQTNGKPVRLRLTFEGNVALRLQVAGDGERMLVDDGPIDEPFDMDEYGGMDIADVTRSLFPTLVGREIVDADSLARNERCVGLRLNQTDGEPFYFWVDGDELGWGDEAALARHSWAHAPAPIVSGHITL
ncbi:hypothetical protein L7H23_18170 [Sphingopyxis sp. BSN-002]|uniref:hypothetical protein n=1 Tax=Sphingopyxis sp. BSN-002 TaxID=2911495 RepID=UPI001EDC53FF|nr:hypothetical protein [Sphingopyxis sp. BSN-002]UKK84471.1 hypothetical protein L7H23_18170 [Sphingopyxis sp. BSN-002]